MMYGWPYPGERDNAVVWWAHSLKNGKPIKVVDNVYNKPLPAWSCADMVWALIQQNQTGIYHAAGRDHVSLYQFALMTVEIFGLDANLIAPVPDSYFPALAPRPQDTSFNTTKMEIELGIKPVGIREGLLQMKVERSVTLSLLTPIAGRGKDVPNLVEIGKPARAAYNADSLEKKISK